jgi:hypothetical protein
MIQAVRQTNFIAYLETEAERIDTSVTSTHIRHLMKFTNDLDGAVFYAYAKVETITNRYTKLEYQYAAVPTNVPFDGQVNLIPAGHFKYELYEVSWIGAVNLTGLTAPDTETKVLPVNPLHGVVQGLVAIGILYLAEKSGSEEVQYTEYDSPETTNTIYYGQ